MKIIDNINYIRVMAGRPDTKLTQFLIVIELFLNNNYLYFDAFELMINREK